MIGEEGKVLGYLESIQPTRIATPVANEKGLVGRSMAFNRMLEMLQRVAPSETTVLLLGESGTGKELAAEAVHALSRRSSRPFVALDCSGLVESLFESELFGHEKGAFTGAYTRKVGMVESANGGTLFLDEVGDLSQSLQVKLLRLIETGTYRRVGSVDLLRADVRLICATHRDLQRMVDEGTFRADLYYRISAFPVRLPSLRERPEDIELLSRSMMMRIAPTPGECKLDPSTMETLRGLRVSRQHPRAAQHPRAGPPARRRQHDLPRASAGGDPRRHLGVLAGAPDRQDPAARGDGAALSGVGGEPFHGGPQRPRPPARAGRAHSLSQAPASALTPTEVGASDRIVSSRSLRAGPAVPHR